jgi:hypothetical protein
VIWGSVVLFAVLFALLTSQLAASSPPEKRPVLVRRVIKRKVVTTVLPTPGRSSVTAESPVGEGESPSYAPVTTSAS